MKKAKIILPVALFVILISYTLFMLFSAYKYELYDKRIEGQQEKFALKSKRALILEISALFDRLIRSKCSRR
ncbi:MULTISPECIES: hypothetical protein [unclassified Geobacillus]|uniref:hypothetical protein n=1 Tax=unclassified Geobacillus TaxID=2642459 RepID=UPI000BE25020|nr:MULTISPECIES: hypothetical protein [unclassified Geobacillus]PDM38976.1 hypothetical protein CN643_16200 [Parageobacillus yumthangensis]RDV23430.1 hypothetical protein DXK91_02415 [Parageobacillus toebii]TXK89753.1 hypothetical protein FVE24_15305 [Parageobacillus sp. SY1]PUF90149.1 hypothetical protein DCC82_14945 [Geobacillus sp. LYN3]TXK88551.1 hypothetical protein FVE68_04385 [Geobacillus sp. AYS3]